MERVIYHGDCREVLKALPDNSVDAVVSDPPYELGFMGKGWDKSGIANDASMWAEVLRVLKPGGHLLAFSGTRTYHRMASAIEDAGFEIRDQMQWLYGSGFPKSLDVSKAIDKAAGVKREVLGYYDPRSSIDGCERQDRAIGGQQVAPSKTSKLEITAPATEDAKRWVGWGTALKPANEPICVARKPLSEDTVSANVLKWGVGALNIDATRIATADDLNGGAYSKDKKDDGEWGTMHRSTGKDYVQPSGRWPSNVLLGHHEACVRNGTKKVKNPNGSVDVGTKNVTGAGGNVTYGEYGPHQGFQKYGDADGMETVEDWDCADECPIKIMDSQSGFSKTKRIEKPSDCKTGGDATQDSFASIQGKRGARGHTDQGGASRFFYCSKVSKSERGEGNNHPTVKPVKLMAYLIRLVTPVGGTVLDPFMGSGSTALAARDLGFGFIGIEKEPEYVEIAKKRLGVG